MKEFTVYTRIIQSTIVALLLLWVSGCTLMQAFKDPDANESDIPWAEPQAWEQTPGIPGMDQGR